MKQTSVNYHGSGDQQCQELRKGHNLRQFDVAMMLDISQTGDSKHENGENDVSTTVLIALAKY